MHRCCSLGHRKGTVTCDREKLVKPILGLLVELYRDRHDDPAARAIWDAIEPNLSRLYPKRFDYAVGKSGRTESRPLFGDLIEAMYYYMEKPESDGIAPHFAPGATSLLSPKFRYNPSTSPEQTPNLRQTLTSASSGRSRARSVRRIAVPAPEPGDGDESVGSLSFRTLSSQDDTRLGLAETRTSTHTLRMTTP